MLIFIYVRCYYFFFLCYGAHRDLHVLTHSFPTRRSSDLVDFSREPIDGVMAVGGLDIPDRERWIYFHDIVELSTAIKPFVLKTLPARRSEEQTSELQSLMRISYAVFCLKKKTTTKNISYTRPHRHTTISKQLRYHK